jgi:hypothetical protein
MNETVHDDKYHQTLGSGAITARQTQDPTQILTKLGRPIPSSEWYTDSQMNETVHDDKYHQKENLGLAIV